MDEKSIENGLEGQKFLVVCLFWGGCHHPNILLPYPLSITENTSFFKNCVLKENLRERTKSVSLSTVKRNLIMPRPRWWAHALAAQKHFHFLDVYLEYARAKESTTLATSGPWYHEYVLPMLRALH